jgi:hypothetical protein
MTTRKIRLDDTAFTIASVLPDYIKGADDIKVSIVTASGTYLVTDQTGSIGVSDTTSVACVAGSTSVVITAGVNSYTPSAGDLFRIGTDAFGWQTCEVLRYAAATKTITTVEFLDAAYPVGSVVEWRNVSYDADTTSAGWSDCDTVTVVWSPWEDVTVDDVTTSVAMDEMPWTETWEVLKRTAAIGAFESEFKSAFPRYHEDISDGQFEAFSTRAHQRLKNYFESKGRNFSKIVDSEMLKEPWLTQIAILVAMSNSDRYSAELETLQVDLTDQLAMLDALRIWDDTNQDLSAAEDEVQTSIQPGLSRGL